MSKDKITQDAQEKSNVSEKIKETMADKIWNEIKNTQVEMFGLANQTVSQYAAPTIIEPSKLYLSYKVGAFLPALETAIGSKYNVELYEKYIAVSQKR